MLYIFDTVESLPLGSGVLSNHPSLSSIIFAPPTIPCAASGGLVMTFLFLLVPKGDTERYFYMDMRPSLRANLKAIYNLMIPNIDIDNLYS